MVLLLPALDTVLSYTCFHELNMSNNELGIIIALSRFGSRVNDSNITNLDIAQNLEEGVSLGLKTER